LISFIIRSGNALYQRISAASLNAQWFEKGVSHSPDLKAPPTSLKTHVTFAVGAQKTHSLHPPFSTMDTLAFS
jgi:hypothetical protein